MTAVQFALGMTATARDTIHGSIAGLRYGGLDSPLHVFAEPGTPAVNDDKTVLHPADEPLGHQDNFLTMAQWLLQHTDEKHICTFEDDIDVCRGLAAKLSERCRSGYDFALACTFEREANVGRIDPAVEGWQLYKEKDPFGLQGVVWRREVLQRLMTEAPWDRCGPSVDIFVYNWLHGRGYSCHLHVPSLLDHVAWSSTTIDKPKRWRPRRRRQWLGRRAFRFDREYH